MLLSHEIVEKHKVDVTTLNCKKNIFISLQLEASFYHTLLYLFASPKRQCIENKNEKLKALIYPLL